MAGKKSPGVGRNEGANLPDQAAVRAALAMEILDQEKMADLRELRKRHRKGAEKHGIVLKDLDDLYKMKDMSDEEVVTWFKRKFNTLGAVFQKMTEQFDLFAPRKGAPERIAAFRHQGMMAGLAGKDPVPPPGLAGDESNEWLEGHKEGHSARAEAWAAQQEEAAAARKAAGSPPTEEHDPDAETQH
jgi:hypothetical protein